MFSKKAVAASDMIQRLERRKKLVKATAKSISGRFEDETDFETIADLQVALDAAQKEIDSAKELLKPLAQVTK